ncbi:MAG: hydrolase [Rubrivivax sp. SCN 70-15]|nr:MAG: hydrolase [Rubrivivax sp. SCN 70-15]
MNARVDLPQAREVCPTTTRRLLAEGALLVDVREIAEVAQLAFDVPGVLLMPMSELEQRFAELPRDRELVLVCQVGTRSLKANYFLMYQGYTKVANMEGGLFKWARKGFPIKGARAGASASTPAAAGGCCGTAAAVPAAAASCCEPAPGADATAGTCCSPASAGGGCC